MTAWSAPQRTGVHPKRGELTIEALAGIIADHDEQERDDRRQPGRTTQ